MGNEFAGSSLHSAEYFGDTRDHWWRADTLELMGRRLELGEVKRALDVGAGVGHWGRLLLPLLGQDAVVAGVEREAAWVAAATAEAKRRSLETRLSYQQGIGEQLPFESNTFDLVTCQTVLMHVASPAAVLAEMKRVVKPGGLVLAAEPNNTASALLFDSVTSSASVDDLVMRARLLLTCHRGKTALGEGNSDLGDALPAMFTAHGFSHVDAWLNDRVGLLAVPYGRPDEKAEVESMRDALARDFGWWSKPDTQRYFLAGGGVADTFETLWATAMRLSRAAVEAVDAGTYWALSTGVFYVVAGRKPDRS